MHPDWMARMRILSDKILSELEHKKIGKLEFAGIVGVTPSTVTKWLKGNHNFTIETLFRIEDALNIRLLDYKPIKKNTSYTMHVTSNLSTVTSKSFA